MRRGRLRAVGALGWLGLVLTAPLTNLTGLWGGIGLGLWVVAAFVTIFVAVTYRTRGA
jgi:amino acid transporter